jgi:signal transduction histidine kinase
VGGNPARFGLGHLVVFVVVALVLNAQFTWWVVHSLRENRGRLDLERSVILTGAQVAALKLELAAEGAARRLVQSAPGVIPAALPPFVEIRVVDVAPVASGWTAQDGGPAFAWPVTRGRTALAVLDPLAPHRWLAEIDDTLHLVEAGTGSADLPRISLAEPLDRWAVVPDEGRWREGVARYRRRVVLVLGEGVLFVAAMVSAVALLWTVLRREGSRERQHQNFVSAVTHELKTPIAGIRLALETVLSGRVDTEGRDRFLRNALADSERLGDLVEKVLEVTRYAGGAHRLHIEVSDLSGLVEEEVMAAERRAAARGIRLEADIVADVRAPFDAESLGIVLSNLVENALKYAQGDPPEVKVTLGVENGLAVITVRDNGVGIAPEELDKVFAPFYRSTDEVTRRTPGTGIGLYVAREIVVAHGGQLTAASGGRGQGAVFRLALPGASVLPVDDLSEYDVENETR